MEKTTNYQLNQWQKSDRIMMSDFNADNLKLDAALAGKLGQFELIREIVPSAYTSSLSIMLDDIDWNEWSMVALTCKATPFQSSDSDKLCSVSVPGGGVNSQDVSSVYYGPLAPFMVIMLPMRSAANLIRIVYFGDHSGYYASTSDFSVLTCLSLYCAAQRAFGPEDGIALLGVR